MKEVCEICGSEDVLVTCWMNPNTSEVDSSYDEVTWCKNCEQHNKLIAQSEFKKNQEKKK